MSNAIPAITSPLGKDWKQPDRRHILVDDQIAVMSKEAFSMLADYSRSIPSGKYRGKMWKSVDEQGKWHLRWYDVSHAPGYLSIPTREIVVLREDAAQ